MMAPEVPSLLYLFEVLATKVDVEATEQLKPIVCMASGSTLDKTSSGSGCEVFDLGHCLLRYHMYVLYMYR